MTSQDEDTVDDDTSVTTPNDQEMEESLDNYIQRLATLEQRLGSGQSRFSNAWDQVSHA